MSNRKHLSDGIEILAARSANEVEAFRSMWKNVPEDASSLAANERIGLYLSTVEAKAGNARPHVILIKQNDRPLSMALGRVEQRPITVKLGYKVLLNAELRCLSILYGGLLGGQGENVSALLIAELMKMLRRGEFDSVHFNRLRTDSCIYEAARKLPGLLNRSHFPKIEIHRSMTAPEDIELFYQARSKKHRANLKRYIRKLEAEYPNEVRVVTYTEEDHVDEAIRTVAGISRLTYQHGLTCGVVDNFETRTLLTSAAKQGCLRISLLFINEQACAFQIGLCFGTSYQLAHIGFDPKWSRFQVGTVLFLKVLEQICADPDIEEIDLGLGDGDYKRSYADNHWQEASVYIFASRAYPIALNMLQSAGTALSLGLKRLADKVGLTGRIKRRWRTALQDTRKANEDVEHKKSSDKPSKVKNLPRPQHLQHTRQRKCGQKQPAGEILGGETRPKERGPAGRDRYSARWGRRRRAGRGEKQSNRKNDL